MNQLATIRTRIRSLHMADETTVVTALAEQHGLDENYVQKSVTMPPIWFAA